LAKPRATSILLPSHLHFDLNFSCQNGDFCFGMCWLNGDFYVMVMGSSQIRQESGPSATNHLFSAPAQSWQC
jgi:hypothetical protein